MKNVRTVYQKLREVKYVHLLKLYKYYLKRIPENCRYNYKYTFYSDGKEKEIRLCLLHQENIDLKKGVFPHLIDVCEELEGCKNCNAFIIKYSKEDVKKIFIQQLKDRKYPDICSLEWVLDQGNSEIPVIGIFSKIFLFIKRKIFKVAY